MADPDRPGDEPGRGADVLGEPRPGSAHRGLRFDLDNRDRTERRLPRGVRVNRYQIAQLNVGRAVAPMDDPTALEDLAALVGWFARSVAYVAGLPPKATRR